MDLFVSTNMARGGQGVIQRHRNSEISSGITKVPPVKFDCVDSRNLTCVYFDPAIGAITNPGSPVLPRGKSIG